MTMLSPHQPVVGKLPAEMRHVHLPTPGDHYSPLTGSATMTVIYETARWHQQRGGTTQVVVAETSRRDYPVGECLSVRQTSPPGRREKIIDLAGGLIGRPRQSEIDAFQPSIEAVPPDFDGWAFVHNAPAAAAALKRQRPRARVALYAHNELYRTYSKREVRRVVGELDRAICVSEYIAGDLRRRLGGRDTHVRVVRNGVDLDRFRPLSPPTGCPTILFLGRVVWHKGPDLLIAAAKLLAAQGHDFRLRVVGSAGFDATTPLNPFEQKLRALAEPLGDRIQFKPFVDRGSILAEFAQANIFCVPSNCDDPCPLTALEGLACGLPMVVSRRGGIPEICGEAALYFAPPKVAELAAQLARLLGDAEERARRGAMARAQAETLPWERTYRTLQEALHD